MTRSRTPARFERMLRGPVAPMLARLAAPNVVVVSAATLVTVADAWYVGRLGTTALASLALVFPVQALMQMMSAGAMGGGVSSAVARALGRGDRHGAEALVLHALCVAAFMALAYGLIAGLGARPLLGLLGGRGPVLEGAIAYAHVAFGGASAMWLANTLASVLRGAGNMSLPAAVLVSAGLLQIGLSGALTLGWGPLPALGIRGPAVALVGAFALASLALGAAVLGGSGGMRLHVRGVALERRLFADILRVGAVACGNALLTIATVLITTRLIAGFGTEALAGFGLGSRLELMLVPVAFGVGGALTASVGANFGAGQHARARRIAWTGGLVAGGLTCAVGLVAALWPDAWLAHFTADPAAHGIGARYLRLAGPTYGLFGLGMALYFASQGTGNMLWPFTAGVARFALAAGGGLAAVTLLGAGPDTVFALVAGGLAVFGLTLAASLFSRVWNPRPA